MPGKTSIVCPVLVGRASQLEALSQLLHQLHDGKGKIALISGEAGIGKTRLIAEAEIIAQQAGLSILKGHCFESEATIPYTPLVDLLRGFISSLSAEDTSKYLDAGARELVKLLPELAEILPDTGGSVYSLQPEQEKRRLFESLVRFLFRVSASAPLLLIVEDLHWSDEGSLDFLLYLIRRITSQPITMLLTVRGEEAGSRANHFLATLHRDRHPLELVLSCLEIDQVEVMIREVFGLAEPVRPDVLKAIYGLTEGNPFYIEEILRSISTADKVLYGGGEQGHDFIEGLCVPLTVREAVLRRMDQLKVRTRRVLAMAAVIGQRFDFALLQKLTGTDEDELMQFLKELITAQLVTEDSPDRFSFRHTLTREAVYTTLLQRERRKYHRTVAETLERMTAQTAGRHVAELAYHFYKGGQWGKALEYSQRAGRQAQALYAPTEVVEHFTHALECARELNTNIPAGLYRERGRSYEILGDFEKARADHEQALESARRENDRSAEWQSLIDLGFLWTGRDYKRTGTYFREALALADQISDPLLRARSLNRLGNWLLNTGHADEALQVHEEALKVFRDQGLQPGMAETLDLLGTTFGMRGDRVQAALQLEQAITLFRTLGDTQSLISSQGMLALQSMPGASETTLSPLRKQEECVQYASEALHLARQIDWQAGQAFTENALAHTLLSFGEFGPALLHAREAQRIAGEIGHQQWTIATYYALGHIYLLSLAPEDAVAALGTGLSLAHELGSTFWMATISAKLGLAYILEQDLPAAEAALQAVMPRQQRPRNAAERDVALAWGEFMLAEGEPGAALQITQQLLASIPGQLRGQPTQSIPHLLKLQGEALMAMGRVEEAVVSLEKAKQGAQERNTRPVLWTIHRSLGEAFRMLGRTGHVQEELLAARQLIEEQAASFDAESQREQFLSAALGFLPKQKPARSREIAKQAFGGLTVREREVAALVARGKTSREIANALVVSERTAEVHVGNILKKLGFSSRTQIAVWAAEKGLSKHQDSS